MTIKFRRVYQEALCHKGQEDCRYFLNTCSNGRGCPVFLPSMMWPNQQ
ncbi:hypothetical protein Godav_023484 [Gossypium davidsonii]|uniref:Uncharacterized protein n=1 Tax=Gossypium davidsonii TaxID=34287 RepID=A0A7J8SSP3_GOSDV|nr:hypothetical protein [Gossypium davidsonii]